MDNEQSHDTYNGNATHRKGPPENRISVSHSKDFHHHGVQDLNTLHEPRLGAQHYHQSQAYPEHGMAYHQERIYFALQQRTGAKRSRPDDLELDSGGPPGQQMHPSQKFSQIPSGSTGWDNQQVEYHSYSVPNQGHRSKIPRMSQLIEPIGGASVIGTEVMSKPAPKPSRPKSKFTPEDDELLVNLKENQSLTWKQIAEFFPGRSSGTLQVRYCNKLKVKIPQWTDETVSLNPPRLFE
jgi:hypothetical protein